MTREQMIDEAARRVIGPDGWPRAYLASLEWNNTPEGRRADRIARRIETENLDRAKPNRKLRGRLLKKRPSIFVADVRAEFRRIVAEQTAA